MSMQEIYDWIDANADECIRDLQSFVQQPSISAQNIGLRECATLIRDMMHRDGLPADFHEIAEGPPVVFGHLEAKKPAKTILCYSHYYFQPP
ncbi:MAG: peptidase M20, partial [Paracoccaceae bacterium]